MVYCNNIAGLIKSMGLEYDVTKCRLFIDLSSRSLKLGFLHNGNTFFYLSLLGIKYKWKTHNMDHLLSAVNYQEHKWLICRDLEVVGLVIGLQSGYAKYPCFLYLWDSQADDQHCQTRVAIKTKVKNWLT